MAVAKLVAIGSEPDTLRSFKVEGTTYNPSDGKIEDWPAGQLDANLEMIARIAAICNDAAIAPSENKFVTSGMPTEAALKVIIPELECRSVILFRTDKESKCGGKVEERTVAVDELIEAYEVFCTVTVVGVAPVGSVTYQDRRMEYITGSGV